MLTTCAAIPAPHAAEAAGEPAGGVVPAAGEPFAATLGEELVCIDGASVSPAPSLAVAADRDAPAGDPLVDPSSAMLVECLAAQVVQAGAPAMPDFLALLPFGEDAAAASGQEQGDALPMPQSSMAALLSMPLAGADLASVPAAAGPAVDPAATAAISGQPAMLTAMSRAGLPVQQAQSEAPARPDAASLAIMETAELQPSAEPALPALLARPAVPGGNGPQASMDGAVHSDSRRTAAEPAHGAAVPTLVTTGPIQAAAPIAPAGAPVAPGAVGSGDGEQAGGVPADAVLEQVVAAPMPAAGPRRAPAPAMPKAVSVAPEVQQTPAGPRAKPDSVIAASLASGAKAAADEESVGEPPAQAGDAAAMAPVGMPAPAPRQAETPDASTGPAAPHATAMAGASSDDQLAPLPAISSGPATAPAAASAAQAPSAPVAANPMEQAVVRQVQRALVQHLPDGGERLVVRLTPPELGTVRIEIVHQDGAITARLLAEDDGVRRALDRLLPSLRAEVRAADLPRVDVTLGDRPGAQENAFARPDQQGRETRDQADGRRRPRADEPAFAIDGIAATESPAISQPTALGGRVGASGVDARA